MFDSIQRSWDLMLQSLFVLSRDKRLLVFPVLSAISTVLVCVAFALPLHATGHLRSVLAQDTAHADSTTYALLFLFIYTNYFLTIFFNSALVAAAGLYMNGAPATVSDGLRIAMSRVGRIAYWALFACTVRLVLRALERRMGAAGRVAGGLLGIAWSLVTYFIVPVLVFENRPVFDAIDRSTTLFKKSWGEQASGAISFGLLGFLASIPAFLVAFASLRSHFVPGIAIALLYLLVLAAVGSAAQGIFTVAVYQYAAHADTGYGFSGDLLQGVFATGGDEVIFRHADEQPAMDATLLGVELMPTETSTMYIITARAGNMEYHASYTLAAADTGFQADSWEPGTRLKLRTYGDWLVIQGPGSPELRCKFTRVPCAPVG